MKKLFFLLVSWMMMAAIAAQQRSPSYFFTTASERYFTDPEMDSLLYATVNDIFRENEIPEPVFKKNFPELRQLLQTIGRKNITNAFKKTEAGIVKLNADKNSPQFSTNKQRYTESLQQTVQEIFRSNKIFAQYVTLSTSDRITYFNSTVQIQPDGKLIVEEKISVYNGNGERHPVYGDESIIIGGKVNNEILRGIVRAFPLYYVNKYKLFQNTTFKLLSAARDGQPENYHTEKKDNGILVYLGSSNVYLKPGRYTYTIRYETDHQLKLLDEYDELSWNVTGNSWSFRIDSAMCTLVLPKGYRPLSSRYYTGAQGDTVAHSEVLNKTIGDSTVVIFKTTKPLPPYNGFTIATSWPKGAIASPGRWARIKYYIWNNKAVFLLPLAALFSALFCFIFWLRYGRDPKKGTIYPLFEPPAGLSPAALGFIYRQRFSRDLTAATIVDAAVRNQIHIDVKREGTLLKHNTYIISKGKKGAKPPLTRYQDFDSDTKDLIGSTIKKGKYNSNLGDLNTALQKYCEDNFRNKDGSIKKNSRGFFARNASYITLPILICIGVAGWAFFDGIVKAINAANYWQFAYFIGGIILCVFIIRKFSRLLAAYSPEGRKLMDKIEGFRMFLATADEKRFDAMNPPKKSLELFEKYLPFAIALGCEIEWGDRFESIINTAYLDGNAASAFSQSFRDDNNSFSSSFTSSFSGAISSASSPPSSSSGGGSSFGGGSSGGGGGGGGGGGW
jgi:uncharacterized membrane protein YgcG